MAIDNFELIKPLLTFNNDDEFYFLQILQRKKDMKDTELDVKYCGSNNNSRLIKAYYIYSLEQLERYKPEIIALCEMFKARAGINLNVRNQKDLALEMLELLARDIRVGNYSCLSKIYNSVCGKDDREDVVKVRGNRWLLDIDEEDLPKLNEIVGCLFRIEPIGDKIIARIPSKSGAHLITTTFNREMFKDNFHSIEIHTNNPTNLYIP